ncbi:hypothetical protein Q5530_35210 [Saccharothrix sp. BKS2]|uniref:hypothetical protein n=1 Tax=Saccharothrix sp. BKS2 TaxID=3064400 RepID=UPI0039ED7A0C
MDAVQRSTWGARQRVLFVIRNFTTVDRVLSVLGGLDLDPEDFIEIKFTTDGGSAFARDLAAHLKSLGGDAISWREACKSSWNLVLAAHASIKLRHLRGPLIIMAHGAGYRRVMSHTTGSDTTPTGLVRDQLVHNGRLVPTVICLAHENQLPALVAEVPEAHGHTVVVGDPVMDQIRACRDRRSHYRGLLDVEPHQKLITVSSTWGRYSSLSAAPELPHRLLAQLPADRFKVALITHWNVQKAHSPLEVKTFMREALDCGLIPIPSELGWHAALIATDLLAGDHGSVTVYGAALGLPVLLVSDGGPEVNRQSVDAELWSAIKPLHVSGDLRSQVEATFQQHDPKRLPAFTDHLLGRPGAALHILNNLARELMRLPPAPPPKMRPVPDPAHFKTPVIGSHRFTAKLTAESPTAGRVELERFPEVARRLPYRAGDPFLVVDVQGEVDETRRSNAEILLNSEVVNEEFARVWTEDTLARYQVEVTAVRLSTGSMIRFRDGPTLKLDCADPAVAASALYAWRVAGHSLDALRQLTVLVGARVVEVTPG